MNSIKNFILNIPFIRSELESQKAKGIYEGFLSGMSSEKEYDESMTEEIDVEAEIEVKAEEKLRDLLGMVDERSLCTYDPKTKAVFIGGEQLEEARILNLRQEASFIVQSDMWKIISESLKDQAHKTMFLKSESFDDMRSGKMMLYNLSVQNKILSIFNEYTPK